MSHSPNHVGELRNIGATVAERLASIGISSRSDLAKMGAVEAYRRMCQEHPGRTLPVCYYLYSLEAALRDVHWNDLTAEEKQSLRSQAGAR